MGTSLSKKSTQSTVTLLHTSVSLLLLVGLSACNRGTPPAPGSRPSDGAPSVSAAGGGVSVAQQGQVAANRTGNDVVNRPVTGQAQGPRVDYEDDSGISAQPMSETDYQSFQTAFIQARAGLGSGSCKRTLSELVHRSGTFSEITAEALEQTLRTGTTGDRDFELILAGTYYLIPERGHLRGHLVTLKNKATEHDPVIRDLTTNLVVAKGTGKKHPTGTSRRALASNDEEVVTQTAPLTEQFEMVRSPGGLFCTEAQSQADSDHAVVMAPLVVKASDLKISSYLGAKISSIYTESGELTPGSHSQFLGGGPQMISFSDSQRYGLGTDQALNEGLTRSGHTRSKVILSYNASSGILIRDSFESLGSERPPQNGRPEPLRVRVHTSIFKLLAGPSGLRALVGRETAREGGGGATEQPTTTPAAMTGAPATDNATGGGGGGGATSTRQTPTNEEHSGGGDGEGSAPGRVTTVPEITIGAPPARATSEGSAPTDGSTRGSGGAASGGAAHPDPIEAQPGPTGGDPSGGDPSGGGTGASTGAPAPSAAEEPTPSAASAPRRWNSTRLTQENDQLVRGLIGTPNQMRARPADTRIALGFTRILDLLQIRADFFGNYSAAKGQGILTRFLRAQGANKVFIFSHGYRYIYRQIDQNSHSAAILDHIFREGSLVTSVSRSSTGSGGPQTPLFEPLGTPLTTLSLTHYQSLKIDAPASSSAVISVSSMAGTRTTEPQSPANQSVNVNAISLSCATSSSCPDVSIPTSSVVTERPLTYSFFTPTPQRAGRHNILRVRFYSGRGSKLILEQTLLEYDPTIQGAASSQLKIMDTALSVYILQPRRNH